MLPLIRLLPLIGAGLFCLVLGPPRAWAEDAAAKPAASAIQPAPPSIFASLEAQAIAEHVRTRLLTDPPGATIELQRAYWDRVNKELVERLRKRYAVKLSEQRYGGVLADVVEPATGISRRNADKVLIDLHGGAFLWGMRSGSLVESIPIAATAAIKVIGVDYRQGPEHVFPAATDDVEAVYRALLKSYRAENIGIYGCSAGGYLTGETVARLVHRGLPLPGAIGIFCAGVTPLAGDSAFYAVTLNGEPPQAAAPKMSDLPYFHGARLDDPELLPALDPRLLAKFPPTLLLTASRDFAMSSAISSELALTRAGVQTELHVWDGMWHGFFVDPDMPESREAYDITARFFLRHLGQKHTR